MNWADYVTPLLGGLLIGLAAAGTILLLGKIAGISGILAGAFSRDKEDRWRWGFLLGLPLGAYVVARTLGVEPVVITDSPLLLVGAGLLVGFGTRLGNGCTSGHGVCGLARGSRRSLTATATFMAVAALTVWLVGTLS